MMPTYGNCKDCAAWTVYNYNNRAGAGSCCRTPTMVSSQLDDGCFMFVPKLAKDAYAETKEKA